MLFSDMVKMFSPADFGKENNHRNVIVHGDAVQIAPVVKADSIDCIITSPPYFQQRKYSENSSAEVGNERTPEEYIEKLVAIFALLLPALKETGSLWLNLGDKYKGGNLLGIPWRVALELQKSGWLLRSDVIWHKPNAMPSSVKNRPTTDHEYLFLLTKSSQYHYDQDAIREPHVTFSESSRMKGGRGHFGKSRGTPEQGKFSGYQGLHNGDWTKTFNPKGRNRRTVWSVSLSKFRGAHFAVFPEKLIEPCVLASCPKNGTVLDPFFGSGTVGVNALKNGRDFLGFEQNLEYCKLAERRISETGILLAEA